jgi:uncharacterized protein YyaL (SSP411 family)
VVFFTPLEAVTQSFHKSLCERPKKKPFYATTYIPKYSRFGRLGLLEFIPRITDLWKTRRSEILETAQNIYQLMENEFPAPTGESIDKSVLHTAYVQLLNSFDEVHGGFSTAPKFPTSHHLTFLLRYYNRTQNEKALQMVEKTLVAMRLGGIYDQIGFGFHRYSTDAMWFLPHFEKMLYDQAMLAIAYLEGYQVTKKEFYKNVAKEIFQWVIKNMQSEEGGFFSALDADSEGEEGKFYLWSEEEIQKVLDANEGKLAIEVFGLKEKGMNVLYLKETFPEIALKLNMEEEDFRACFEQIRIKLLDIREKRIHPHCDDKILTDWNGLMIAALSKGAQVLGDVEYAESAEKAALFILSKMHHPEEGLFHTYCNNKAKVRAFLDDYAFFIWGLIELYQATFKSQYLKTALDLNQKLLMEFWDEDHGGFYFTSRNPEHIAIRNKEVFDGPVPSGNSIALLNLVRLGRITGDSELHVKADKMLQAFSGTVRAFPSAYTQFLNAVDFALTPSCELVVTGNPTSEDTRVMLKALVTSFMPNLTILFVPTGNGDAGILDLVPFLQNLNVLDSKATAYVCRDYKCATPTTEVNRMLELL